MKTGHAVARVTFTAAREMVREALEAGWSAKAIYDQNQPKLSGISYRQFVRYVNEMRAASNQSSTPAPVSSPAQPKGQPSVRKASFDDHDGIVDPVALRKLTSG